jgi:hypothetical protein
MFELTTLVVIGTDCMLPWLKICCVRLQFHIFIFYKKNLYYILYLGYFPYYRWNGIKSPFDFYRCSENILRNPVFIVVILCFTPHIYFIILISMIASNLVEIIRLPQIQYRKCLRKFNFSEIRSPGLPVYHFRAPEFVKASGRTNVVVAA